ncbi:MAG: peptidyl-prolyl cis-trans isomerase [Magnetococcus sp. YQC-5]
MQRNRSLWLLLIILFLILAVWYWLRSDTMRHGTIVARVGPRVITFERFEQEMVRRGTQSGNLDKKKVLEELVEREMLLVQALEQGVDSDPEVIKNYHNLLIGSLKKKLLTPQLDSVIASDAEISTYYNAHIEEYTHPPTVHFALLFLSTHAKMDDEQRTQVKARMQEARKEALLLSEKEHGFGPLAIHYSEDQATRYTGGDIGWLHKGRATRWEAPVVDAGFALSGNNQVSEVIATNQGVYLVKRIQAKEGMVQPLAEVSSRIRHKLVLEKGQGVQQTFMDDMKRRTPIETYWEVVEKRPLPGSKVEMESPELPKRP